MNDETLEYLRDFDPADVSEVPAGTPYCFYITGTVTTPEGGLVPSIVYENISGHFPLTGKQGGSPWVWGDDYASASKIAQEANARLGVDADRAMDIVSSSFRAAQDQGKL